MPNAENAILDPFSAMAPTQAIMVAVCGLVVVFLMLAILALVIRINSKLVSLLEGRKEEPAPAPVKLRKTKNVSIKMMTGTASWRLESKEDIDRYMDSLRKSLEAQLDGDTIVNVEF